MKRGRKMKAARSSHKPTSGEEVGKWTLLLMKNSQKKIISAVFGWSALKVRIPVVLQGII